MLKFIKIFFFVIMILFGILVCVYLYYSSKNEYNYTSIDPKTDKIYIDINSYDSDIREISSEQVGKKYYLCKVFGVLLFHNNKNNKILNDSVHHFLKDLNKIGLDAYKRRLNTLVKTYYKKIDKSVIKETQINLNDNYNISLKWIKDSIYIDNETSNMLNNIILNQNNINFSNPLLEQSNIGVVKYTDIPYASSKSFPDSHDRFLGLFYYWNFIEYFYPYKNLLDTNWDDVLLESITDFETITSVSNYKKNIIKLISHLDDNHSIVHPQNLTSVFGEYVSNFRMVKTDRGFVVNKIRSKSFDNEAIKVGDIILEIDSTDINKLYSDLEPFVSGANIYSKNREIAKLILCKKERDHTVKIKRNNEILYQKVSFFHYQEVNKSERKEERFWQNQNVSKQLSKEIGYININHLFEDNIDISLQNLHKFTKGVVIDMRGYPNAYVSSKLVNFVISKDKEMYCTYYPDIRRPGLFRYQIENSIFKIRGNNSYQKKIVVLVDDTTQSHAEFLVMIMQSNTNVSVVGNTSSGTDGNVTSFTFPGNIEVKMTGIGILYPDFSQTQRKGVRINHHVDYNLKDISNGLDSWINKGINLISKE